MRLSFLISFVKCLFIFYDDLIRFVFVFSIDAFANEKRVKKKKLLDEKRKRNNKQCFCFKFKCNLVEKFEEKRNLIEKFEFEDEKISFIDNFLKVEFLLYHVFK